MEQKSTYHILRSHYHHEDVDLRKTILTSVRAAIAETRQGVEELLIRQNVHSAVVKDAAAKVLELYSEYWVLNAKGFDIQTANAERHKLQQVLNGRLEEALDFAKTTLDEKVEAIVRENYLQ